MIHSVLLNAISKDLEAIKKVQEYLISLLLSSDENHYQVKVYLDFPGLTSNNPKVILNHPNPEIVSNWKFLISEGLELYVFADDTNKKISASHREFLTLVNPLKDDCLDIISKSSRISNLKC